VAGVVPNLTAVAPVKLRPVITTDVPPAVDPVQGETFVTIGPVPEPEPVGQLPPVPVAVKVAARADEVPAGVWVPVGWYALGDETLGLKVTWLD